MLIWFIFLATLFRMLNIHRHNENFSSYQKRKKWFLNNGYFQSTFKALSRPRMNVLLGEWNQQDVEKRWPFWFSNKHFSEGSSRSSGDFTVIHSNVTHLCKYQYLSFLKRPTFFKVGYQKSTLMSPYIDCYILLIKMVPGLTLEVWEERNHIEPIYFSASEMCSSPFQRSS